MTGATPPLARNRLPAALLYSGRPVTKRLGTQYWGGNGRPGRPYGYGPVLERELTAPRVTATTGGVANFPHTRIGIYSTQWHSMQDMQCMRRGFCTLVLYIIFCAWR